MESTLSPIEAADHDATDPLLTVEDLAARFNVKKSWVYVAVASGKLPHVRIGKYLRFRPDQVSAFLQSQSRGA